MKRSTLPSAAAALLLLLTLLIACADKTQVQDDPHPAANNAAPDDTDPPSDPGLKATDATLQRMRVLRSSVDEMNALLAQPPDTLADAERTHIVELLAEMNAQVNALIDAKQTTGHANLDASLDQLRAQIERAHNTAQASPPDYFEAANVAAACLNCHGG